MHLGGEFAAAFIVCVVLAVGAAAKMFSRRVGFPYTVLMLLLGLGLGLGISAAGHGHPLADIAALLERGAGIDPELILFVLLPALVFESAFALDQRAFVKEARSVGFFAVPGMLLGTVLVAGTMVLLTDGGWSWGWPAALVFGALISATDPVAVVALLRDTGAPVRLGALIEGESLLNDGTAIVVFGVLISLLAGGEVVAVDAAVLRFGVVVVSGAAIGLALAAATTWWLRKTFNEPLVEITLTVVVAYMAMLVAEGFFHVSGVIAVVVAGLWLGAKGRTAVSPEVTGFLHHFWEMLAHIANTLIFFLVGLVIAAQLGSAKPADLLLVLAAYAAVVLVRAVVVFAGRILLNVGQERVSLRDAALISWGGLRGAVSLALALIVSGNESIPLALRQQILLMTAGVVLLSILVNGTTTGWLLRKLDFDKQSAGERLANLAAHRVVIERVQKRLDELSRARALRTLPWDKVEKELNDSDQVIREQRERLRALSAEQDLGEGEAVAELWRQALRVERQSYWQAFAEGTLGARAVASLDLEVSRQLDIIARGHDEVPYSRSQRTRSNASRWQKKIAGLHKIALAYDISRAESTAAEKVLSTLGDMSGDADLIERVSRHYRRFFRCGKEDLEEMRINQPKAVAAIEARLAQRIRLNVEREEIRRLVARGAFDNKEGAAALASVESRMKGLHFGALDARLESPEELCRKTPLFATLGEGAVDAVAKAMKEHVLSPGETLFKAGDRGTSVFIIVRGAVRVQDEEEGKLLDVLGAGEVLGEMAFLTGAPRTATIRAATTVTLEEIDRAVLEPLMEGSPDVREQIWDAFAVHSFDNSLRKSLRFGHLGHAEREAWIGGRPHALLEEGQALRSSSNLAFLVAGCLKGGGATYEAPALINLGQQLDDLEAASESRVVMLPPLETLSLKRESRSGNRLSMTS